MKRIKNSYILGDINLKPLEEKSKPKMTITNNVKKLLDLKKKSINQFSKDIGVTYVTAYGLYHDLGRSINNDLLNRLCRYFGVGPGEILIYLPDPEEEAGK
jgi:DNA-binding Xre family transcriptional regulator